MPAETQSRKAIFLLIMIKRSICLILAFLIFAFICDTDRVERGRFMDNVQRVIDEESLSVASAPIINTDAVKAEQGSGTGASEFRTADRQGRRIARSCELLLLFVLLIAAYHHDYCGYGSIAFCDAPGGTVIIEYMMRQDGKK